MYYSGGQDCLEKKRVIQRQKERKKKEKVKERRERTKGIMKHPNPREIPSTITICFILNRVRPNCHKEEEEARRKKVEASFGK